MSRLDIHIPQVRDLTNFDVYGIAKTITYMATIEIQAGRRKFDYFFRPN